MQQSQGSDTSVSKTHHENASPNLQDATVTRIRHPRFQYNENAIPNLQNAFIKIKHRRVQKTSSKCKTQVAEDNSRMDQTAS
jgi:hypothetical protein